MYIQNYRALSVALGLVAFGVLGANHAKADVLAGWDVSTLPGGSGNFGPSPFAATTTGSNTVVGGLTRGSGVSTAGTAAAKAWGGTGWTAASEAAAITANTVVTFTVAAASGYTVSFSSLTMDYRRSGQGATSGELQYSLNGTTFVDVAAINYSSTSSSGASITPIDLSGVSALQNVTATVTFRIVNWGGSASAGTWYVYDKGGSTANDLIVNGLIAAVTADVSIGAGTTFTSSSFGGAAFSATNTAVFNGAATAINLSGAVAAAGLTFTSDGYTLASPTASDTISMASVAVNTGSATISGHITGNNALTKTGTGVLVLSGSNDFVGNVTVSVGTLQISSDANLGNSANDLIINTALKTTSSVSLASGRDVSGAGTLDIAAGTTLTSSGAFNMTSVILSNTGTLSLQGNTRSLGALSFAAAGAIIGSGDISLTTLNATALTSGTAVIGTDITFSAGNKTVDVGAGGTLELDGLITLNGSRLSKSGLGTLILNGSNDGGVSLGTASTDGGTIVINNSSALGTGLAQFFHNGGTLRATTDLTGANAMFIGVSVGGQTAAATFAGSNMEFAGASGLFSTGTNRIVVNNTTIFSGGFTGTTGSGLVIGGTGSLVINTATASLTTNTLVTNSATLVVDSTWTCSSGSGSGITVDTGATIKGGGSIIGGLTVNGTIAPGDSPGLLTVDSLTLGSTATAAMELAGTSRGSTYDAINVTGLLTLDGTIKVSLISGYDPVLGDTFDLIDWGSLVDNTVTFDFSNAALDPGLGWDTTNFTVNGTIAVVAIPEPGTLALVLGGLGLVVCHRIRRRA